MIGTEEAEPDDAMTAGMGTVVQMRIVAPVYVAGVSGSLIL